MQERFLRAAQDLEELVARYNRTETLASPIVAIDEQEGLSLTLRQVTITYSLPLAQESIEEYLAQQRQSHSQYLNVVERINKNEYENLSKLQSRFHRFLQRKIHNQQEMESRKKMQEINIAVEKVILEGGLVGNSFFREIVKDDGEFAPYLRSALEQYQASTKAQEDHAGLLLLTENIQKHGTCLLGNSLEVLHFLDELHKSYQS